jgi:hypothetical protein
MVTGHDYAFDVVGDIAGGTTLTVDANTLVSGDVLDIDLTAATSSAYYVIGGAGDDIIRMGALRAGEQLTGGAGFDTVTMIDMVENMSDTLEFSAATLAGIERLVVTADNSFDLRTIDANVAAGETLEIDGTAMTTKFLGWNGLAETDGHFDVTVGAGGGYITGGTLSDTIEFSAHTGISTGWGRGGADDITCNTGEQCILVTGVAESNSTSYDSVHAFDASVDKFDLAVGVSAISFDSHAISAATFDADMGTVISDQICAVVTATGGDLIGHTFLFVDGLGGSGGYQAGADYIFDITGYTGTLDTGDFI